MKKRILSLVCILALVITSVFAVPVMAEESVTTFTDEFENLNLVSSYDGEWDVFPAHNGINRSVIGRRNTSVANNIYYTFADKYINSFSITVAEYTGFFNISQVPVYVLTEDSASWSQVTLSASEETEIEGATNASFKHIVLTSETLPENVSGIKIGLTNNVAWTLFLDNITLTLSEKTNLTRFSDTLENLDNMALSSDAWSIYNPHLEIKSSVIGKTNSDSSTQYIYYNFKDSYIADLTIDAVVATGYYTKSNIEVCVLTTDSEEWKSISMTFGEETVIEESTNNVFKSLIITSDSVPYGASTVRIGISNAVNWTLFLDNISINLTPKTEEVDYSYITDEYISLSKASSYDGNWDIFNSSYSYGLSLIGRNNTEDENTVYYSLEDSYLRGVTLKIVEHAGYINPQNCVSVAVKTADDNSWSKLDMTFSEAKNIKGYEDSTAKSMTLSADVIFPAITDIKISITNDVAWTLMLDSLLLKTENISPALVGDVNLDKVVNILDLVRLKKNMTNIGYSVYSDLDGDAMLGATDITCLKKYLLGISEFDSAEGLKTKREIATLKNFSNTQLSWIAATQLQSGAIPVKTSTAEGNAVVNPYFADYAAMALLERPELYAANVSNYITWHFDHLNEDGTIYDYTITAGEESHSSYCDSTDSYAATFLTLLNKFYEKTTHTTLISENIAKVDKVIEAMLSTYDNALTYAKADYLIKYTMDNCEVYLGLKDAANIYTMMAQTDETYSAKANELLQKAEEVKTAIEEQLWNNSGYGYYEVGLNDSDSAAFEFDWTERYPSAMAQLFPIFTGVIAPDSERAVSLYETYLENFDITSISETSTYYCFAARTAAVMGDNDTLRKYLSEYSAAVELGSFRNTAYTAQVVMAAEIFAQQLSNLI